MTRYILSALSLASITFTVPTASHAQSSVDWSTTGTLCQSTFLCSGWNPSQSFQCQREWRVWAWVSCGGETREYFRTLENIRGEGMCGWPGLGTCPPEFTVALFGGGGSGDYEWIATAWSKARLFELGPCVDSTRDSVVVMIESRSCEELVLLLDSVPQRAFGALEPIS